MRKKILQRTSPRDEWWDLNERVSEVAVTSEDSDHPVDAMLAGGRQWRAAEPGDQTILLTFSKPQKVGRIFLRFVENDLARTQEFGLAWSGKGRCPPQPLSPAVELQPERLHGGG